MGKWGGELTKYTKEYNNEELLKEYSETEDEIIKDRIATEIINSNKKMIFYIINRHPDFRSGGYQKYRMSSEDLESLCMESMYKAICSYDITKGYKFMTYATMVINNDLGMASRKYRKTATDVSVDKPILLDGSEVNLLDMLSDTRESDFVDDMILQWEQSEVVKNLYHKLTEVQKKIYICIYLYGKDQRETARIVGLSQSYISRVNFQIIEKGRELLKNEIRGGKLN